MIITSGELLVEFISHNEDCGLKKISNFSGPYPSGAPAIFIDQAARMGASTIMIGAVGNDPFGDSLLNRLQSDGVNIDYVQRLDNKTTGTAFVSYFENGERIFVFHMEDTAADHIPSTFPELAEANETILHVSGASLGNSRIRQGVMALVEKIKGKGQISYDPNIRPELMKDSEARIAVDKITELCDIFLPSYADLEHLFPNQSVEDCINNALNKEKKLVAVKQGKNGVTGSVGSEIIMLKGHDVEEIDPTGAGDCFCGILIGLIDQGKPFKEALELANAGAALHVTQRGPMEFNPTLDEIKSFLS